MRQRSILRLLGAVRAMRGYRMLTCLVIAALVAQTFVTAYHFHFNLALTQALAAHSSTSRTAPAEPTKKSHGDSDSDCPIRLSANVCGAATPINGLTFFIPSDGDFLWSVPKQISLHEQRVAPWQSRAPPSA